ncbi:MAG: HTH domain-containing protein [Myxococcaceae bacterium]
MSERAQKVLELLRILIGDLTLNPSPKFGEGREIWLRQATLAEHFGCSRTTIWRAIKQLKEAGLITDLNKRYLSRYKIYSVLLSPSPLGGEGDTHSVAGEVPVSKPKGPAQLAIDEIEEVMAQYGETWQKQHPYFGTHPRPTLRHWVGSTATLGKGFRLISGKSLPEWIEDCLNSRSTEQWAAQYALEQLALIRAAFKTGAGS